MASIGDKYIVTIDYMTRTKHGWLYGVNGMKTLVFDDYGLSKLEKYDPDLKMINAFSYSEGYADGEKAGYEQGLLQKQTDSKGDEIKNGTYLSGFMDGVASVARGNVSERLNEILDLEKLPF